MGKNLSAHSVIDYCRNRRDGFPGGQRLGRERGQNLILEAREFASLQLANNAPWLAEAEPEEDGE